MPNHPSATHHPHPAAGRRPFRLLPLLLLGLPALLARGPAAQQASPVAPSTAPLDIAITLFSYQGAPDQLSVVYGGQVPEEQVRQDFRDLARNLGVKEIEPSLSVREGFTDGSAEVAGLTDWAQGTLKLDPLLQTFRRYGYFQVTCLYFGSVPRAIPPVNQPPLRIESTVNGSMLSVRVWVDQSRGVPDRLPTAGGGSGSGWRLIVGITAVGLVLLAAAIGIVYVLTGRRRQTGEPAR